jgi:hypothetical protein
MNNGLDLLGDPLSVAGLENTLAHHRRTSTTTRRIPACREQGKAVGNFRACAIEHISCIVASIFDQAILLNALDWVLGSR